MRLLRTALTGLLIFTLSCSESSTDATEPDSGVLATDSSSPLTLDAAAEAQDSGVEDRKDAGSSMVDAAEESDSGTVPPTDAGTSPQFSPGLNSDLSINAQPDRLFDLVMTSTQPSRTVIFLHGGGGTKEMGLTQVGLDSINQSALDRAGLAWIFPQGARISGGAATWSNHVMDSGQDDVKYLADLAQWAKQTLNTDTVVLAGHSNGGMMTHRMWCEADTEFTAFMSIAGPPALGYARSQASPLPCTGTKPYWAIVGERDRVLQTTNALNAGQWTVSETLVNASGNSFINPNLVNEIVAHEQLRVPLACPQSTPTGSVQNGSRTIWRDCNGAIRLWLIAHPLANGILGPLGQHPVSVLEEDGNFTLRDLIRVWQ